MFSMITFFTVYQHWKTIQLKNACSYKILDDENLQQVYKLLKSLMEEYYKDSDLLWTPWDPPFSLKIGCIYDQFKKHKYILGHPSGTNAII